MTDRRGRRRRHRPGATRRWVEVRWARGRGGHPRLWAFGYPEMAHLFGMSEGAVRQAVHRGLLDPVDLASVMRFALRRAFGALIATVTRTLRP